MGYLLLKFFPAERKGLAKREKGCAMKVVTNASQEEAADEWDR